MSRSSSASASRRICGGVELGDLLGIKVKADYATFGDGYTGDFIVPGDWLRKQAKS